MLFTIFTNCIYSQTINEKNEITLFFNSDGIIEFIATDKNISSDIVFLNEEDSDYLKINFENNKMATDRLITNFQNDSLNETLDFSPFDFFPDDYILRLVLQKQDSTYYWVYLNSDKTLVKKIKKNELFQFLNWTDFMKTYLIDFDEIENPLRKSINGECVKFKENEHLFFQIDKIEGDWVHISHSSICDEKMRNKKIEGWIKWKINDRMIIKIGLVC